MLLLHIIIAISSIISTTYVFISPSKSKLNISYGLVGATIATGTFLVLSMPSHMVSSCITGLLYLGVVTPGLVFAHHKLAKAVQKS